MRRALILLPVLGLGPFLLHAPGAAAQASPDLAADTFTLVGQVLDVEGDLPIDGAAVTVVELDRTAMTNWVGRFSFPGLPAGTWTFRTRRFGYAGNEEASPVGPGALLRVRLLPRPVEVPGLLVEVESAERRLRDRRLKASTLTSVRSWGFEALRDAFQFSATRFIEARGLPFITCSGPDAAVMIRKCWQVKGTFAPVCVMVDDTPLAGGVEALDMWAPQEFHTIEVYRNLRQVRAYTHRYMMDLADRPRGLMPVSHQGCPGRLGT